MANHEQTSERTFAALVNLGVVYLVLSAIMAFTLVLSAKMKSPYMVLVVLAPVLFIPLFLSPNGTVELYNLVLFLLPYRAIIPKFKKYITYQFGEIVIDLFTMRAVVDLLLIAVLLPLANRIFRNHQVA
ncbi:hypothetical protein IM774_05460 [Erysipelotrichaceae bacterium RD49]|nr:hypothetical protein [Erysipelotrichaceae bacterium RD49]